MNSNPLSGVLGQAFILSWRATTSWLFIAVLAVGILSFALHATAIFRGLSGETFFTFFTFNMLLQFLAYGLLRATITSAIYNLEQTGTVESIGTTLRRGFKTVGFLIPVELLILVSILLLFSLLSPLASVILLPLLGIDESIFLGILIAAVPCIYLYCRAALAPVQIVVDPKWAVIRAIKDSWCYTRGLGFSILLRLVGTVLIIFAGFLLLSLIIIPAGLILLYLVGEGSNLEDGGPNGAFLLGLIFFPFATIFQLSVPVLLYCRLTGSTPGAHSA